MKVIVKDELRTRLTCAAQNGSTIAKDILAQLKENKDVSEIIRGKANYFATKRKRQSGSEGYAKVKIVFTYCNKDITNDNFPDRNNPQAPWFNENRTEAEPSTFVGCFKNLPEYSDEDMEYFANSICVMSRVTVKLYEKMSDIEEAYCCENYSLTMQYGESTLHNSCMRYEQTSRNAADFYYNFAGAKIIVAKDAENNILGRAILWKKVMHSHRSSTYELSFIDRVYYSHSFVMKLILQYADSIGINLRKSQNDYNHTDSFIVLNEPEDFYTSKGSEIDRATLTINVPASKWHKSGAPYMDTFAYISLKPDGELELSNRETGNNIASCRSTSGYATYIRRYCPNCGKLHSDNEVLCHQCQSKLLQNTFIGNALTCKTVKHKDRIVPACFMQKGRPIPTYALHIQIQKLYK